MLHNPATDVYSPDEIARAAGVLEDAAVAVLGNANALVPFADAVLIGRSLRRAQDTHVASRGALGRGSPELDLVEESR